MGLTIEQIHRGVTRPVTTRGGGSRICARCGELYPCETLEAHRAEQVQRGCGEIRLDAAFLRLQVAQLRFAIRWALGEVGEFKPPAIAPASQAPFWWRSRLRELAGDALTKDK